MVFVVKQRICLLFLSKSAFGFVVFFHTRATFFTKWRLSLIRVKLCSAQKFMVEYNIIQQIHIVIQYIRLVVETLWKQYCS